MKTFLEEQVEKIVNQHGNKLNDVAIIIPNKRAAVHIQRLLAEKIGKAFFSPEILTINEWIDRHTEQQIVQKTELLFILYEVHISLEKSSAESFSEFSKWGGMMLSDFDEIDRYLVNPKEAFQDLKNIKDIENWSFGDAILSEGQKNFLDFWEKLPIYYERLNEKLGEQNKIYAGRAYRNFYAKVEQIDLAEKTYFIGFNALSKSEEEIIKSLVRSKKADVAFDIDKYYLDIEDHEAAHFYKGILGRWGMSHESPNNFNAEPKTINIIEAASQVAQAKICGTTLSNWIQEGKKLDKTAVVLADESLFIPLLRSLPAEVETANITMGYPLKFTQLQALIDLIFEIQFEHQRFGTNKIYHHSVQRIIEHPYIEGIINDKAGVRSLRKEIVDKNKIYLEIDELTSRFEVLWNIVNSITKWNNYSADGCASFENLANFLIELNEEGQSELDIQILYHFSTAINKFKELITEYSYELDLKTFKRMFNQFWQSESLSFFGNPIDGLQVMGILETRTLDFENLIILGMNEGILPRTNVINSFIPWDLRRKLELPMEEDRQAIFAHHFYRLMHRSKNVSMTYNSTSDGFVSSEKSRYLIQLENEIDLSKGHKLQHLTFSPDDEAISTDGIIYKSTKAVQQSIIERLEEKISPSALNTLIDCPLDFYYRYILRMSESSKVEESFESSTFGTKIHEVLQYIFQENFLKPGNALDTDTLNAERKKVSDYLLKSYIGELMPSEDSRDKNFNPADLAYGYNKLAFDMSVQFIERFIDQQIKEINTTPEPIYIETLEKEITATYEWELNGEKRTVRFAGIADRIDRIGNKYRIVDYKSGKCDFSKIGLGQKVLDPGGFDQFLAHDKKRYGRQLMLYALMFRQEFKDVEQFSAGIISMVNIKDWVQNVRKTEKEDDLITPDLMEGYELSLKKKLEELLSDNYEFEHNPKALYCQYCNI